MTEHPGVNWDVTPGWAYCAKSLLENKDGHREMDMFVRVRRKTPHLCFATSIFLLAVLLIAACDTGGSTTTPAPRHHMLGEHVQAGAWVVTITHIGTNFGQGGLKPKVGDNFLVIYILLNNNSSKDQTLAVGLFSLSDATHKSINEIKSLTEYPAELVHPGKSIQGAIVYEVSTSNPNFTLTFAPPHAGPWIWDILVPTFSGPQSTPSP